jgi:hypothetical protein
VLPGCLVDAVLLGGALDAGAQIGRPALGGAVGGAEADQRELLRQEPSAREVVQRRHQQPHGKIAAAAEDHHGAGIRRLRHPARRRIDPCDRFQGDLLVHRFAPVPVAPVGVSTCPPKAKRIAERIFSPNVCS